MNTLTAPQGLALWTSKSELLKLKWTAHGLGFIKAYIAEDRKQRIHIYNKRFVMGGVTMHHDHPWHLHSRIISGVLRNTRYLLSPRGEKFTQGFINCRNFHGIEGETIGVHLQAQPVECYRTGDQYYQEATEIHETEAMDGTVTLVTRIPVTNPDGRARVFWPTGTEYINAAAIDLTRDDIEAAIEEVLCLRKS